MFRVIVFLLLLALHQHQGISQHIPDLINFKGTDYKAHNQNWSVSQSSERWMYFANTEGLLSYNGNQWTRNSLDNNKIVRSVHCHSDRIYTGTYEDFGYWMRDDCGHHHYTSLKSLIPDKALDKEEVWHITSIGNEVYFQSFSRLLRYDGKTVKRIELPGSIMFLHIVNNRKILQVLEDGLYEIKNDKYEKLPKSEFFADKTVTGISALSSSNRLLVSTSTHGVFTYQDTQIKPWTVSYQDYFIESQVNRSLVTNENYVIIGTIRDGLLVFDINGALKFHFKSTNGLQNNTVLSVIQDVDGQVWLGLDKGIAYIKLSKDILYYKDQSGKLGTVYCLLQTKGYLYIGTNQGLYYKNISIGNEIVSSDEFKLVKGTQGQVWELKDLDGKILCGHNNGTFLIDGKSADKISDVTGGWFIHKLNHDEKLLMQGTYTGLIIFKKINNAWKFSHRINGFTEPIKKIIQKNKQEYWVTGPNLGLSLLKLDESLETTLKIYKYGAPDGLQANLNTDINLVGNRLMVFDGKEHYFYDEVSASFRKEKQILQGKADYFLRVVNENCFAKVYQDSLIIINHGHILRYQLSINKDYHSIKSIADGILGVSLNEGYAILDLNQKITNDSVNQQSIKFSSIKIRQRDICIGEDTKPIEISNDDNDFRVYFYDTEYTEGKKYWYRVLPDEVDWKPVAQNDFLAFRNLPYGKHSLEIKCERLISSLDLQILPPWYSSKVAYLFYFILALLSIWFLKQYFDRQLRIQTEKLNIENERLLREQRIAMENDRLQQDNLVKSKELANSTMHLVQKNELLQEIKEELMQIRKSGDQILTGKDFQIMMKQINDNLTMDDDKKLFNASFEDVHETFIKKLKSEFPDLTSDDLKLAAYLRMSLTTKDIAPLFNLSLRGVENKRYRLRKKMKLDPEIDLSTYFINFV